MCDGEGFAFTGDREGFCKIKMFVFLSAVAFEIEIDGAASLFRLNLNFCGSLFALENGDIVLDVEACDNFSCVRPLEEFAGIDHQRTVCGGDFQCVVKNFRFRSDGDAVPFGGSSGPEFAVVIGFEIIDVESLCGERSGERGEKDEGFFHDDCLSFGCLLKVKSSDIAPVAASGLFRHKPVAVHSGIRVVEPFPRAFADDMPVEISDVRIE